MQPSSKAPSQWKQLFLEHPEALLLWDPFNDHILAANAKACELAGVGKDGLQGTPISRLHAGELGALIVFTESVLARGEAWTNRLSWQLSDDDRRAVEYNARRIERNGETQLLVCARDLETVSSRNLHADADTYLRRGFSEWRRVEEIFAEIESDNRLILHAAGEGIYGVDAQGATTFVNPAAERMLGYHAQELIGRDMHPIIHHSHQDGSGYHNDDCPIYKAFREGAVQRRDTEVFWRKDGRAFPVEYTSTPIVDHGRLIGAVIVFRDISDRRDAERQLHSALEELGQLKHRLELENDFLQQELQAESGYREIVGRSRPMQRVIQQIELVAPTNAPVLITGESGTGKELIARALHATGERSDRPFVRVNCAAIPADLFESEFFGHVRGAFTGALNGRIGRFELAHEGTLFLDEISEIPLALQGKLLRVLQEGQFERVGDTQTRDVDVRIIAATNRQLQRDVAAGAFREDLYYRLNVFPIESVPLRDRREDIPLLAAHFLEKLGRQHGRQTLQLRQSDAERLKGYDWPGNVRELENLIERAIIVSQGERLMIDLPAMVYATGTSRQQSEVPQQAPASINAPNNEAELIALECQMIEKALTRCRGKVSGPGGAAEALGLKPTTLESRIRKHAIDKAAFKTQADRLVNQSSAHMHALGTALE